MRVKGHHLLSFLPLSLFRVRCFSSSDGSTIPLSLCSSWSKKVLLTLNIRESASFCWLFLSVCFHASRSEGAVSPQLRRVPQKAVPQTSAVWPQPACNWRGGDTGWNFLNLFPVTSGFTCLAHFHIYTCRFLFSCRTSQPCSRYTCASRVPVECLMCTSGWWRRVGSLWRSRGLYFHMPWRIPEECSPSPPFQEKEWLVFDPLTPTVSLVIRLWEQTLE